MTKLDSKKHELLKFIDDYWDEHAYGPQVATIADEFVWSKSTTHRFLLRLMEEGEVIWPEDDEGRRIVNSVRTKNLFISVVRPIEGKWLDLPMQEPIHA